MERPTARQLVALLYIRVNRPLPQETVRSMIDLGFAHELCRDDANATYRACGRSYGLTLDGNRMLDGTDIGLHAI